MGAWEEFIAGRAGGTYEISELPKRIKAAMQTSASTVFISKATYEKQSKHSIDIHHYHLLPSLLKHGEILTGNKPRHHLVFSPVGGEWMVAVLKVTQNTKEVYLQSYRRTDPSQIDSWRKRGKKMR